MSSLFPLMERKQDVGKFLARASVYKRILRIPGSIIEGGVYKGAGLATWAKLSAVFEPENYTRKIIGFDTFSGFPSVTAQDGPSEVGQFVGKTFPEAAALLQSSADWDTPGYPSRVELIAGDAAETIPVYAAQHPELVVALLHLDFDLYEPTVAALTHLRPLMPDGAVIAFDELNMADWPGETQAVKELLGLNGLRIRRFPYTSTLSYLVL